MCYVNTAHAFPTTGPPLICVIGPALRPTIRIRSSECTSSGFKSPTDRLLHRSPLGTLLDPELVHRDKRIGMLGLKGCPVAQFRAARIAGKARAILMQDAAIYFETDELKAEIGKE